ncbi:hypothetical protein THMIRHAM_16800 [Thiomicrorhabdus immobilis]|uniref:HIRAN domain-containing protein n=1 Tax=Thiomicrorhabdus immobilis TaxID=2791037 RepID=A0ABM7MEN7_9GAMM|nr:HIRAN domain-containing protein [Thiomicrorhabdus immobilis]BCN93895.1 hypothetical protein THMIRHAM_16800 [Thiomicrorhabdus immobilis]
MQFPIKGTFYYAADMAIELSLLAIDETLRFQLEPENPYDENAVQIWLPKAVHAYIKNHSKQEMTHGLLLGYVPRSLAPKIASHVQHPESLDLRIKHYAKHGKQIEIDCLVTIDQAWLNYLSLLIHSKFISQIERFKRFKQRTWNKST